MAASDFPDSLYLFKIVCPKSNCPEFIKFNFLAKDSKTFREYYNSNSPRLDYNYEFEGEDGGTFKAMFQLGANLFWF